MPEEIEEYDKNLMFSDNTYGIIKKRDEDDLDSKISVCETALNINDMEKENCTKNDKCKQCATYTVDNIKTELPLSELHNVINKHIIENVDIKSEFKNELQFCDSCKEDYQDYCTKCGMLVHILNRNALNNTESRAINDIPNQILEIKESTMGEFNIFALKLIPKGVKFGPCNGLGTSECSWKIKTGNLVVSEDRMRILNWMRYIKPTRSIFEKNLLPFQCEGNLYYHSICNIQVGEELLVYFDQEYADSLNGDVKMDFIPHIENDYEDVFSCTFCCLGFSSRVYLAQHKNICPNKANVKFSIEELTQCQFCTIYLGNEEYFEYHMSYCCERNGRKSSIPVAINNKVAEMKKHKTQRRQTYTCTHCKYKTMYKSDLKSHTNNHFQVKMYKCETCDRRFKTVESLKVHLENIHMKVEEQDIRSLTTNDSSNDETKPFKCTICKFRTKNKNYLKIHIRAVHLKEYNHKCVLCEYKAKYRSTLRKHIIRVHRNGNEHDGERKLKTEHLKKFIYKCATCEYKSYYKGHLKTHFRTKHLKEFDYNCASCVFKTNYRSKFKKHVQTKHLHKFSFKCDSCEYKTNINANLQKHIQVKHLKEFRYKCDSCDYKTNRNTRLEVHIKAKHLEEFDFKCESCDYVTFDQAYLRNHIKTVHLKEYSHKCESCDFKTNVKFILKEHIKTKHLREFDYNCADCEYRTNHKSHFTTHVKRKHTKEQCLQDKSKQYQCPECEFQTKYRYHLTKHVQTKHLKDVDYKCAECKYVTSHKPHLDKHIRSKHLKEFKFKCAECEYQTNDKSCFNKHAKAKHPNVI